jgi:hypothetical protein
MTDYKNYRVVPQKDKRSFLKGTFRTLPIMHTSYKGMYRKPRNKAIIAMNGYSKKWEVVDVLEWKNGK